MGAGPSGLILALLLGQKGIKVDVLDASTKLDEQPRATHYNSPATHVLQRVGVLDEIRERGVISKRITWRKPDGELLAALDLDSIPEESPQRMVALPLNEVSQIVVRHLQSTPSVNIKWAHNVVDVGQNENAAWVDVETPGGKQRMEADYIIGCDGANSKVRRALQGDLNFPGKTWDEQIVATNVSPSEMLRCYTKAVPSPNRFLFSGVLRLSPVWLGRCKLHHSSGTLVHGFQDQQRRALESVVRRSTRAHSRTISRTPADEVRNHAPWASKTRSVQDHQYQPVQDPPTMRGEDASGTVPSRCGCRTSM